MEGKDNDEVIVRSIIDRLSRLTGLGCALAQRRPDS